MIYVAVTGGRIDSNSTLAFKVLGHFRDTWPSPMTLIHGNAKGYDRVSERWAQRHGILIISVPIDHLRDGYKDDAPKRRNQRMLDDYLPDCLIAFPGGAGTRDMYTRCLKEKIPVYDVVVNGDDFEVYLIRSDTTTKKVFAGSL